MEKEQKIKYVFLIIFALVGTIGWFCYFKMALNHKPEIVYDQLSATTTITLVSSVVWYHSRGKLQELKGIINREDVTDPSKHGAIKLKIENMLKHRTKAYIREFNSYDAPIKNLGNLYAEYFDFENFLVDVYKVVFREFSSDKKLYEVELKISEVADIMEKYQNLANYKLQQQLNSLS